MANKLFSFFKQGNVDYEVKDAQARNDITSLVSKLTLTGNIKNVKFAIGGAAGAVYFDIDTLSSSIDNAGYYGYKVRYNISLGNIQVFGLHADGSLYPSPVITK